MDERMVATIARNQHGLITRSQAHSLGLTSRQIDHRVAKGRWFRQRPGVYIVGAAPTSWEQLVHGACLAAGDDASASHRTGARSWELVDRSGRIEITIDSHRRVRLPSVTVHRSILLPGLDRTRRDGLPVTTLERTIVDLSPSHGEKVVGGWIDLGIRRHGLDLESLAWCISRLTVPGRPTPISAMRALVHRQPGYDPGRSTLESRALAALAIGGCPDPVRQHPAIRPNGTRAFIDLAYPRLKIAIELDGWDAHGIRSAFEPDRIRANDLVLLGWTVLRFTWSMTDVYLCETVAAAIARATMA